jgi:hypothetical protein
MGWTLFFMIVILKIPMIAALWLVWYAVKAVPEPEEDAAEDDRGPRRKLPPTPRWPRRGPVLGGGNCKPAPCPQEATERVQRPAPAYARRPERV